MANVNLFQFIVPLTFLAIWALTSLLNRDAQPLPPRPMRPPAPPGPRPQNAGMPTLRPGGERRAEPRDPPQRWSNAPGSPRPAGRPAGRPDDDILIIEVEPRRGGAGGGARSDSAPAPRKGSRGRASQPAPPKRQDAPTPRALSASLGHEAAGQLNRHMELNPLAKLQTPLSAPVTKEVAAPPNVPALSATLAGLTSAEILTKLNTPAKLREAVIMAELLRPPLAMRGGRRVL